VGGVLSQPDSVFLNNLGGVFSQPRKKFVKPAREFLIGKVILFFI